MITCTALGQPCISAPPFRNKMVGPVMGRNQKTKEVSSGPEVVDVRPFGGQSRPGFLSRSTRCVLQCHRPAARKAKIKITSMLLTPGSGPESAQRLRSHYEHESPDPPLDPPGGRGDKTKIKNVLTYSWDWGPPNPVRSFSHPKRCWVSKRLLHLGELVRKGRELRPTPLLMGFPREVAVWTPSICDL